MLWFVLWFVLVVAALAFFALLGLWLFRKAKAVTADLAGVSEQFAQVSAATRSTEDGPGTDLGGVR